MTILDFNAALTQDKLEEVLKRRTVDAVDVKNRINADPQGFIEWLYKGRALISRGEARIGDVYGTPGGSLSISLKGAGAGLWFDHATGEKGDLLALYMACWGYGQSAFSHAVTEIAAEYLGDPVSVTPSPWQESAARRIEAAAQKLGTKPRADMLELGPKVGDWKYYDLHGNVIASVARFEPEGGDKTYRPYCFKEDDSGAKVWKMGAPDVRPLYRIPQIITCQTVVLVEGEKCAEALAELGIDATTAMQGAKAPVEKTDWSPLRGKNVIIWPDNDTPGMAYSQAASDHLRMMGCQVAVIDIPPGKPAGWDAADAIAEAIDPHTILATARIATAPERFRLFTIDELTDLPPPQWIVQDVLTEDGISLLWAPSDCYKSFVAIDLAMSIGTGREWFGKQVKQGLCLYFAAEDANGVRMRMIGWQKSKGKDLPKANVRIMRDSFALATPDLHAIIMQVNSLPERPRLIVIDTLAKSFGAGDENKTPDMNAFVLSANRLREATGANVMIVHHAGLNTERERGSQSLRAGCDTIIACKREGDKVTLLNHAPQGKQKNAEPFADIPLRIQQVHYDHRGQELSTLICMPDDSPVKAKDDTPKAPDVGLGGAQQELLKILRKHGDMGLLRLTAMTKMEKTNVLKKLNSLTARGLLVDSGEGTNRMWSVVKDDE